MEAEIKEVINEIRQCGTRLIKDLKSELGLVKPSPKPPTLPEQVFTGTLHVVNVNYVWGTGTGQNITFEYAAPVFVQYLTTCKDILVAYCRQYSDKILLNVDQTIGTGTFNITLSASGANAIFSDTELQTFVDSYCTNNNIPKGDAIAILMPAFNNFLNNTDAPSINVGGYHSITTNGNMYMFVNVVNLPYNSQSFNILDEAQAFTLPFSHETCELLVDPLADDKNPEVCDPCAGNCGATLVNYYDINGNYLYTSGAGDFKPGVAFTTTPVCIPSQVQNCPPSDIATACMYAPPKHH